VDLPSGGKTVVFTDPRLAAMSARSRPSIPRFGQRVARPAAPRRALPGRTPAGRMCRVPACADIGSQFFSVGHRAASLL